MEDPAARKVNIRWSGAEVQRATFIASALDVYARFSDLVARALKDNDWARQVFTEVKAMAPLLLEVRQRWYAHWQGA